METAVKTKQDPKQKFLVIGIAVLALVAFFVLMFFGPIEYIRSKKFNNGIKGTYVYEKVIVPYTNKTFKGSDIEDIFRGMEIDVYSNGTIDGLYKDYTPKLEFDGDLFNFPLPLSASYNDVGGNTKDLRIENVDYAMSRRDNSIENDRLTIDFEIDGESFSVYFEKTSD